MHNVQLGLTAVEVLWVAVRVGAIEVARAAQAILVGAAHRAQVEVRTELSYNT